MLVSQPHPKSYYTVSACKTRSLGRGVELLDTTVHETQGLTTTTATKIPIGRGDPVGRPKNAARDAQ